jgi:hypothetical protein
MGAMITISKKKNDEKIKKNDWKKKAKKKKKSSSAPNVTSTKKLAFNATLSRKSTNIS